MGYLVHFQTHTVILIIKESTLTALVSWLNIIPSSELQIPDGSIVVGDATVFILEVKSGGSWESTTLKLSIHLCKMLASLHNCRGCESIQNYQGYIFHFRATTQDGDQMEVILKITTEIIASPRNLEAPCSLHLNQRQARSHLV